MDSAHQLLEPPVPAILVKFLAGSLSESLWLLFLVTVPPMSDEVSRQISFAPMFERQIAIAAVLSFTSIFAEDHLSVPQRASLSTSGASPQKWKRDPTSELSSFPVWKRKAWSYEIQSSVGYDLNDEDSVSPGSSPEDFAFDEILNLMKSI